MKYLHSISYLKVLGISLLFIISLPSCSQSNSQTNQVKIDSVRKLFEVAFNEKNAIKMYELTGEDFKKEVPEKEFMSVAGMLTGQLGKWNRSELQKNVGGVAFYKATFEKANQSVLLSLDKRDKLSTLLFQEYVADKPKKTYQVATDNKMLSKLDLRVDSLVRPYIQMGNTAGVCIAVIRDGKVETYSYGETKLGEKKLPDADKTLFEIGSISKTFTAILLADEVVKGKMSLEDPISKYLPDSIAIMAYKDVPITLKTLSNHSSGFPRLPMNLYQKGDDENDPYKAYDENRMYRYLKNFKPFREVGVTYEYSNFAVGLLGNILAKQNKISYEQLLQDKICKPLKLTNTKIALSAKDISNFAQGYNEKGEPASPWTLNTLEGAGGIRSTVNDMVKYLNANMGKSPESLQKAIDLTHQITFSKGQNFVGLGWHANIKGGRNILQHSGGTGGFRTFVGFDKNRQVAVVVLSNATVEVSPIGMELLK